ncbi:hypothetical protein V8E36_001163 [Tilletia maclaganii]
MSIIRLTGSTATAQAARNTAAPTHGSRTLTINATESDEATTNGQPQAVLRLRGAAPTQEADRGQGSSSQRRRVVWADDTVDNEHLGKKSSKICCIYHKPRAFDESDSDESSDSEGSGSDSSDPESDSGASLSPPDSDAEHRACDHPAHQHAKPVSFPFKHGKHPNAKKSKSKKKQKPAQKSRGGGGGSRTQTITADADGKREDEGQSDDDESRLPRKPNKYERGTT